MHKSGIALILALLHVPLYFFIPLASQHDSGAVLSQYLGSASLICMGLTQLMATRAPGLEMVFGGLDQIYKLHKWLGLGALAAFLLHDTIDAELDGLGRETALTDIAETAGEISLYGMLILLTITVLTFVPYHLWKKTHKLMGAFFALSAFHFAFIQKPFGLYDPLGLYILFFCVLGILAYLVTLAPAGLYRARHRYRVTRIENAGDAVALSLQPEARGIRHHPGQFAFIHFDDDALGEPHPFTISSAPKSDRSLRFTVKPCGDYTSHMARALKVGSTAHVSGAFGHFRKPKTSAPQIWIAGGIGITPFLAWLDSPETISGPVHLFYCVRNQAAAAHLEDLDRAIEAHPSVQLHLIESRSRGRLNAEVIRKKAAVVLKDAHVFFCGPEAMRETLIRDLTRLGLRRSRFHYEEFEIRSGIGIRKFAKWLARRFTGKLTRPAPAH